MTDLADPTYLRAFAAAAREEGDEETAVVIERAAEEIEAGRRARDAFLAYSKAEDRRFHKHTIDLWNAKERAYGEYDVIRGKK